MSVRAHIPMWSSWAHSSLIIIGQDFGCLLVGWGLVPPSSSKLVRIRSLGMVMDALLFHSGWSLIIDFYRPYLEKPGRSPGGVYWGGGTVMVGRGWAFVSFLSLFFTLLFLLLSDGVMNWSFLSGPSANGVSLCRASIPHLLLFNQLMVFKNQLVQLFSARSLSP